LLGAERHIREGIALAPSVHGGMRRLGILAWLGKFSPMLPQQISQPPRFFPGRAKIQLPVMLVLEHAGFAL
jgi:hypothetical protein